MFTPELVNATIQEREREVAQLWRGARPHDQGAAPGSRLFLERIKRFSLSSRVASVFRTASAS